MARMRRPFIFLLGLFCSSLCFVSVCNAQSSNEFLGSSDYLKTLLNYTDKTRSHIEPQWLLLGHYKKQLWGDRYLSEVDGLKFFFSPLGKTSPKEELQATLRAFFEPIAWHETEDSHPQCRFLARRGWIVEHYKISSDKLKLLECKSKYDWIKKLNADRVSIIFAASYMNNPASMFGHTFLKFHTRNQGEDQDLLNYGMNFAASTGNDGGVMFTIKGLIGAYPGQFSMTPYYLKLLDYSNLEGRDIWDYQLNLTEKEVFRLITHVLELEQTYFDYYFFSENCSYHLLGLLEWARPTLDLQDFFLYHVIPADTIRLIAAESDLVSSVKFRPALSQSLEERLKLLNKEEQEIAKMFFDNQHVESLLRRIGERSKPSQALILDAALAFGAVREFKEPKLWRQPLFQLQSERARLGLPSRAIQYESALGPPHTSHPPARLALGGGYQKSSHSFLNLNFRFAYHELTDSDRGLLNGSHIQFISFQSRWWQETSDLELTQFRLVDFISLSPWGIYQKPLSWKVSLGYENTFSEDMAHLSGGVGSSIELLPSHTLVAAVFTEAEIDYQRDFKNEHFLGVGPGALVRWNATERFRFVVQTRGLWETQRARWATSSQADISYNWNTHNQLHLRYKNKNNSIVNADEVMLVWERFLLL